MAAVHTFTIADVWTCREYPRFRVLPVCHRAVGNVRSVPTSPSLVTGPPAPSSAPPRRRRADLVMVVVALVLAVWVTSGLWRDPNGRAITVNSSDQALFEWLLAFGAHALTH